LEKKYDTQFNPVRDCALCTTLMWFKVRGMEVSTLVLPMIYENALMNIIRAKWARQRADAHLCSYIMKPA
jgi:hypothetical protein